MKLLTKGSIAALISLFFLNTLYAEEKGDRLYTFGIVPQSNISKLADDWLPLLDYLNARTKLHIRFATAKNITEFEKSVSNGEYDFIYVNPKQYIAHHKSPGYTAFARDSKNLQGIIVVRKDSAIQRIEQLAGKTIGFPAPTAFGATVLPLKYLEKHQVKIQPKFMDSHDSVYLNVVRHRVAAGGGVAKTLDKMPLTVKSELKILWQSPQYTPHAIAAHPRVPAEIIESVKNALIDAGKYPDGKTALDKIGFKTIVNALDRDWDDVRALEMSPPK